MTARGRFADGFVWLTLGNGAQQLISFLVFLVLAWRLSPADFGIVALAAVFIDLLALVVCLGQLDLIQQRRTLGRGTTNASFWLLQACGALATLLLVAGAPALARFMAIPTLDQYLVLLSPALLLATLGQVHEGLMRRNMDYRPIAARNIAAMLVSGGIAIGFVLADQIAYALVAQRLAYAVTMTAALWIACPWRPGFRGIRRRTVRALAALGLPIMAANISAQMNVRIIDFIVGLTLGAYWLGQLKIAWRIFDFLTQVTVAPVASMALRLFARAAATPAGSGNAVLEILKVLAVVSLPAFLGLSAIAPELVPVALGAKWTDGIPLIQALGFMAPAAVVNNLYGPLLIAHGRSGEVLLQSLGQNAATALFMAASAGFGPVAVVVAHLFRAHLLAGVNLVLIRRAIRLPVKRMLGVLLPPVVACAAMGGTIALVRLGLPAGEPSIATIAALVVAGASAYLGTLLLGDGMALWPGYLRDLVRAGRDVMPFKRLRAVGKEAS